ncbi:hypothetical protein BKK50_03830 [Rodentibacter rarus]|uniref:Uncharacterized protein n=1 Tax=Rodentibacter rarus TaxID=1908260 RepID=A0A1V3IPD4_9PAST|nr:hypothetical protein [Rodentibacter rarus]OOF43910.1 hypothetical protein BKK50_03830 [Rodentibacter rarus]
MTLFDECKDALSSDFHLLSLEEEKYVLEKFYKYPFEYGNINKTSNTINAFHFNELMKLIDEKEISSKVYILSDMKGIPIFKTNLLLALSKIDDISALSTKVFILGDGYLAQIVPKEPPIDIVRLLI